MFVNGQQMDGALPIEELRASLDRALADAGAAAPSQSASSSSAQASSSSK
jgi:hypothetical protein